MNPTSRPTTSPRLSSPSAHESPRCRNPAWCTYSPSRHPGTLAEITRVQCGVRNYILISSVARSYYESLRPARVQRAAQTIGNWNELLSIRLPNHLATYLPMRGKRSFIGGLCGNLALSFATSSGESTWDVLRSFALFSWFIIRLRHSRLHDIIGRLITQRSEKLHSSDIMRDGWFLLEIQRNRNFACTCFELN